MVALRDLGMGRTENGAATRMKGARARIFRGETNLDELERYRSGQTGQTVNLLAQPSEVRILPSPPQEGAPARDSSPNLRIAAVTRGAGRADASVPRALGSSRERGKAGIQEVGFGFDLDFDFGFGFGSDFEPGFGPGFEEGVQRKRAGGNSSAG